VPIVVGGTNLSIRAFLEGLDEAPAADPAFRAALEAVPSAELHARLADKILTDRSGSFLLEFHDSTTCSRPS
jgi:tRNA A37 N6-isopentenylltransferase MiaA